MKKLLSILISVTLLFSFASCNTNKKKRYEAEFLQLFDTMTKIIANMDSKEEFTKFSTMIHDTLEEYHKLYNIYDDYEGINNIKTINDNAGKAPVKVDQKIIDLLKFSKEAYVRTAGKTNIALGAVLKIWHNYREAGIDDPENASLPPMQELAEASKHTDINNMIIDEKESTVYLFDPLMSLDVGAIAKGYATEQVCQKAIKEGYTSALLSVGGNVRAIGSRDGKGENWSVGVRNPELEDDTTPLLMTKLVDKSVVTSGIYERYYTVGDKNYHHIIDPLTLMPATYFKAVTIICKDSGIADELSTALFCMPYEEGLKLIRSLPETEALWVMLDGKLKYSDYFKDYIKK